MPPKKAQWAVHIVSGRTVEVIEIITTKRRQKATIVDRGDTLEVFLDELIMV